MSKQEHIAAIKAENKWGRYQRSPAWEKAFADFNTATKSNLRPSCGSCFKKVEQWLAS